MGFIVSNPNPNNNKTGDCVIRAISIATEKSWDDVFIELMLKAYSMKDRQAFNEGVRDILANQNAGIQTILDKMCQSELDAERRENASLRTQLQMRDLAASQSAQTAQILADNAKQTVALEQYLNPTPIPAYTVANPNCCYNYNGCGCGA